MIARRPDNRPPQAAKAAPALGVLPRWDLTEFYGGPGDPRVAADLSAIEDRAQAFEAAYAGKLAGLSGAQLATAFEEMDALQEQIGKLGTYAGLMKALKQDDTEVGRFVQSISEGLIPAYRHLLFFELELNGIDDATFAAQREDPALASWGAFMDRIRADRPHQLSTELERYITDKAPSGAGAWVRLYDETLAGLRFTIGGESHNLAEVIEQLASPDEATRREAATEFGRVLEQNGKLLALVTNTLAKDKATSDEWRHYERSDSAMNKANQVEDEVVDALSTAVQGAYPRLSHRYYAMKAKWLGKDKLDFWDRLAPLPDDDSSAIPFDEARDMVLAAYGRFSPKMAAIAKQFFDNGWIDAPADDGKESGAFAHPCVPSMHPFVLLNYLGKKRDVATMAHELGHGVHQVLAGQKQGYLRSDTPLTLAETASVFGEMLTFQELLGRESDPVKQRAMLAGKVEDMLNTVVRQVAFYEFEKQVHAERRQGELTPERLGEIWHKTQEEALGPSVRLGPEYGSYWSYISHFVHSPFYVYSYAFGDCLVNALYEVYREQPEGSDFAQKYMELLEAGGTKKHKELLAPFGLDASDPAFWQKGLSVIEGYLDRLEQLDTQIAAQPKKPGAAPKPQ